MLIQKMKGVIAVLFVLCSFSLTECKQKGTYAVLLPSILRPGQPLDISVQILTTDQPITVTAFVTPVKSADNIVAKTQIIKKQGIISLEIPSSATLPSYTVNIQGNGEVTFKNQTNITTEYKTRSVFVQTDKGIYKPGHTVHFRVLAVDSAVQVYKGTFDIYIKDPNKSLIKQWIGVKNDTGVFTGTLALSEEPVLGDWTIQANTGMSKDSKTVTITVAEYVLPKFEVTLNMPKVILPEHKKVVISVLAKYTYGKDVKGTGDMIFNVQSLYYSPLGYGKLKKSFTLSNGKADITISRTELLTLFDSQRCSTSMCHSSDPNVVEYGKMYNFLAYHSIVVTSTVTEDLTGNTYTTNGTIKGVQNLYSLKLLEFSPDTYKPGMVWKGVVQIQKADDSSLIPQDLVDHQGKPEPLSVRLTCTSYDPYSYNSSEKNYTVDVSGLMEISFVPNNPNATECDIMSTFRSASVYSTVHKFMSKSNQGIQVVAEGLNDTIKVDSIVKFSVTTTENINGFYYQILSKGLIVKNDYIESNGQNSIQFSITFDKTLCRKTSPSARMVAWYVTDTSEVVASSMDLEVDGSISNNVKLDFSKKEVSPGSNVSLSVFTLPNSFVGMMAVDQSVLLLNSGNDITPNKVMSELRKYDSSSQVNDRVYGFWCWPIYTGGRDTTQLLENAGVHMLTDALIYKGDLYIYPMVMDDVMAQGAPPNAGESISRSTTTVEKTLKEPTRIRQFFPETWIWTDEIAGPNGEVTINTKVPDTITSWVASAFSINSQEGLGVTDHNAKITVIKPFFLSLNLPYSIIRGEKVALQSTVFNYLKIDVQVVVTLESSSLFKVQHPNEVTPKTGEDTKVITVPSGEGKSVFFWIVPIALGQVPLSVKARSTVAADAVKRNILVEPEGIAEYYSKNMLFTLDQQGLETESLTVIYPTTGVVPGSQRVVFTAIGNIMGPSIAGLDGLIKMPYGCGEQNMVRFAPNIYIMQYLDATDQDSEDIKDKALKFMEQGYQRELRYRRDGGSFSAFGNNDKSGSTWLTAFVIRCFQQAKRYITIDQSVIDQAAKWIIDHQSDTGAYQEPGRVLHFALQGGSSKGLGLTAYVLASLLEVTKDIQDKTIKSAVDHSILKAIIHVESQLPNIKTDPYALSLVTYALVMANSNRATEALGYLNNLAINQGSKKYWTKEETQTPKPVPLWRSQYHLAQSYNIEMTAYGLMIYTLKGMITDGVAVAGWLSQQRNDIGGYRSTQDTVMALAALSMFESLVGKQQNENFDVSITVDGKKHSFDTLTSRNNLVLQSIEIDGEVNQVEVMASGIGTALVQMSIYYHMTEDIEQSGIKLTVTSDTTETGEVVVSVCGKWLNDDASGMIVYELNALTGYEFITENLLQQYRDIGAKRIEKNGKTLHIYLDEITKDEVLCLNVKSVNVDPVADLKDAVVSGFAYYRPDQRDSSFYMPQALKSTLVCSTCSDCCNGMLLNNGTTVTDNCVSKPCLNGGVCVNSIGSAYFCRCNQGFAGINCQKRVINLQDNCRNNPCQNGGVCTDDIGDAYYCRCKTGFSGTNCQVKSEQVISDGNGGSSAHVTMYTVIMTVLTIMLAVLLTL